MGTFAALSGGLAAWIRLSGQRLPEGFSAGDLALMTVATHKASRLLAKDRVTSGIRPPFTRFQGDAGPSEVSEAARGRGVRRAIGELIICPLLPRLVDRDAARRRAWWCCRGRRGWLVRYSARCSAPTCCRSLRGGRRPALTLGFVAKTPGGGSLPSHNTRLAVGPHLQGRWSTWRRSSSSRRTRRPAGGRPVPWRRRARGRRPRARVRSTGMRSSATRRRRARGCAARSPACRAGERAIPRRCASRSSRPSAARARIRPRRAGSSRETRCRAIGIPLPCTLNPTSSQAPWMSHC